MNVFLNFFAIAMIAMNYFCYAVVISYQPLAIGSDGWESVDLELENRYGASLPVEPRLPSNVALNETSIFVGVAAFREHRCGRTLFDAYAKAVNPRRVYFGVVDQLLASVDDQMSCLDDFCSLIKDALAVGSHMHLNRLDAAERSAVDSRNGNDDQERKKRKCLFANQVRVNRQNAFYSRGPTYARHLQQLLLRDELFCLQVDAHTLFAKRWDELLVQDWLLLRNEHAVLTTYLPHIDQIDVQEPEDSATQVVPHLCKTVLGGGGMERNAIASAARSLPRPKLTPLWGAGLSFSKCHAEIAVPYDPHLDHVFDGEEFSRALRLFTWGYDNYTPHRNRVFHDYNSVRSHWKVC